MNLINSSKLLQGVLLLMSLMAVIVDVVVADAEPNYGKQSCSAKTYYKTRTKTKTKTRTKTKTKTVTVQPTCTYPPTPTPTLPACAPTATLPEANYDDLAFTEPEPNPIGTYLGLTYNNFYVDQFDFFIPPATGSQYAMSYSFSAGPRKISIAIPPDAPKSITKYYHFTLKSLSVACNCCYPQGACTIQIKGTKIGGKEVFREVIYDALDSSKGFEMEKVVFDETVWTKLKSVEFLKAEIDGTQNYTGLMVDQVSYLAFGCA